MAEQGEQIYESFVILINTEEKGGGVAGEPQFGPKGSGLGQNSVVLCGHFSTLTHSWKRVKKEDRTGRSRTSPTHTNTHPNIQTHCPYGASGWLRL